ncbi:MAG: helix-turn-helix transcriptional regulator [Planctomycetota bacterium]|jgi:prophage regulatory protein
MTDRLLRLPVVLDRIPWGRSTLYAKVKTGDFPAPVQLAGGRTVAWLESEIQSWIESQAEARKVEGAGS